MVATEIATLPTEDGTNWYRLSVDDACQRLDVDLPSSEVAERRQRYGPNKLAEEAKEPAWQAWLRQYRDLMQLVLVGAALVSIVALQDISTGVVVLGLTVVNALMGLHQEGKAAESVAALRQMLIITASVRRDGEVVEVPAVLEWRDPNRSVFNRNTIANGRFNILVLVALALTFLVTSLDGLERVFDTVELTGSQWRACFIAVVSYLALAELGKLILRRIDREAPDGQAAVTSSIPR
jgi:magnesium-transporting ATPase (P-type)